MRLLPLSSVVSGGADGQVRRYDTSPKALESMEDPSLLYDHDKATCIAVSKEVIIFILFFH
jgi:hypothetical protein